MYFVYVDWTLELIPRPFYVGKGSAKRIKQLTRNSKHHFVMKSFGCRREIVFTSNDESMCLSTEINEIAKHHTYYRDPLRCSEIACNFTQGGEGTSGYKQTSQHVEKRMIAHRGKKRSNNVRKNISNAKLGVSIKKQTTKRRSPNLSKERLESMKRQFVEMNKNSIKLGFDDAQKIQQMRIEGLSWHKIGQIFNVSDQTVGNCLRRNQHLLQPHDTHTIHPC